MRRMETRDGARAIDRTEKSATRREEKPCCCIILNLPEYLLSRPYSVYIRSPMHMAPKRVLSFLFSSLIFLLSLSLSFFRFPSLFASLLSPSLFLARSLVYSLLLFSSRLPCIARSISLSFFTALSFSFSR